MTADAQDAGETDNPQLVRTERGLALVANGMELRGDFTRLLPRLRPGNLHRELVVRAAKVKGAAHPAVIDATAGLGEDSLLLAASGFSVTLYERDPVIAALLRDALERACEVPELAESVSRMRLVEGDSIAALEELAELLGTIANGGPDSRAITTAQPDVVLLDPMFPSRRKSASVKKKLQLLQLLEKPCDDEGRLLRAALAARPRKVVVKRPAKGPALGGVKPSYSLAGKAIRYDVIIPPA